MWVPDPPVNCSIRTHTHTRTHNTHTHIYIRTHTHTQTHIIWCRIRRGRIGRSRIGRAAWPCGCRRLLRMVWCKVLWGWGKMLLLLLLLLLGGDKVLWLHLPSLRCSPRSPLSLRRRAKKKKKSQRHRHKGMVGGNQIDAREFTRKRRPVVLEKNIRKEIANIHTKKGVRVLAASPIPPSGH